MAAGTNVTAFVGDRANFLFVRKINHPDFFHVVLFIEMLDVFFQKRPVDLLAAIDCPRQGVPAIRRL